MMNLLSHPEKDVVRREHLWRFLEVCGFMLIALLGIAFVFLLPSFMYIRFESDVAETALASAQAERVVLERDTATQALVHEVQDQLALLKSDEGSEIELSSVISALLAKQTPGVAITSVSFGRAASAEVNQGVLDISGNAATRSLFLNFVASLESEKMFARVESPITNLIKDRDLNYVLHLNVQ